MDFARFDKTGFYSYKYSQNTQTYSNIFLHNLQLTNNSDRSQSNSITHFLNNKNTLHNLRPTNKQKTLICLPYQQKLNDIDKGYFIYLKIHGVGYRVYLTGQVLTFKLGFSHQIKINLPTSIKAFLPEPTLICLYGIDKNEVTQTAAVIQSTKKPSPYKGKGVRILNSHIRLKVGKRK